MTLLYDCIHQKLYCKVRPGKYLKKRDLYYYLKVSLHVDKKYVPCIVKEMENENIIRDVNKTIVEVRPFNKELETNKVYARLGVF